MINQGTLSYRALERVEATVMNNFNLTDQEVDNILAYVDYVYRQRSGCRQYCYPRASAGS